MNFYEKIVIILVQKILSYKKLRKKWIVYLVYSLYLGSTIAFIYATYYYIANESNWYLLIIFIYAMVVMFLGVLLSQLELLLGKIKITKKFKIPIFLKENYLLNRFKMTFVNTLLNLVFYLVILYVLLESITVVGLTDLPHYVSYIFIVLLPIFLVLFINIRNKGKVESNIRRIISYLLLLMLILFKSYHGFLGLLEVEEINEFTEYFFATILIIFTALDNVTKAIIKDYKYYKENSLNKLK